MGLAACPQDTRTSSPQTRGPGSPLFPVVSAAIIPCAASAATYEGRSEAKNSAWEVLEVLSQVRRIGSWAVLYFRVLCGDKTARRSPHRTIDRGPCASLVVQNGFQCGLEHGRTRAGRVRSGFLECGQAPYAAQARSGWVAEAGWTPILRIEIVRKLHEPSG